MNPGGKSCELMGWNRHRIGNPGASDPTPLEEGGAHTRGEMGCGRDDELITLSGLWPKVTFYEGMLSKTVEKLASFKNRLDKHFTDKGLVYKYY